jgi:Na+-transporting NADH:ubiquinone oxidoreductase subunit F
MAPLRAHIAHLLESQNSARKISYWYGARSRQEIFYEDYFRSLESRFPSFHFHLALSSPLEDDKWSGHVGFIHEVVREQHLRDHPNAHAAEYYLCGPPMMIKACKGMLDSLGVPEHQIAYDEF